MLDRLKRGFPSCCPEIHRRGSCGLPMVIVQQSAEARPTGDLAICPVVICWTDVPDELATDALVKPLGHVVLDEFLDQVAQMSLAEDDEVIETLVLDGFYKALRVWIAIWTLRRNLHALHASRFENRDERLGERRISVDDRERGNWSRQQVVVSTSHPGSRGFPSRILSITQPC